MGRDPLMIWGARSDALYGLVTTMQHGWRDIGRIRAPTLYLLGAHDQIIPREAGAAGGRAGCRPATAPPTTREGWHLLLRDKQAHNVWADVAAFIRDPAAPLPSGAPPIPGTAGGALVAARGAEVERAPPSSAPVSFMTIFSSPAFEDHEALHAFHDGPAGLNCLIAIHSTALGPAAGGVRMWPYPDDQAAIDDALRLSRAMSHKNAMAELELGGGKTVIIGDPAPRQDAGAVRGARPRGRAAGRPLLGGRGRRRQPGRPRLRPRKRPATSPASRAIRPRRAIPARSPPRA